MQIFQSLRKFFYGAGQSFSTWANYNSSNYSQTQLLHEYNNLTYICTKLISEEVGKYEPLLFDIKTEKPVYNHPFINLLNYPNPNLSKMQLFAGTQAYLELTGNAFWILTLGEQTGKPKSIKLIRPDVVTIVIDEENGQVKGYKIRTKSGTDIPFNTNEIIHYKTFNPLDDYYGLGTLQAGLLYVETEKYTSKFQRNFLYNQATPSGVLTINGKISTENFQILKRKWQESHAGVDNAGKTLFIRQAEAKFEKLGLNLADLNMEALKKLSKEDVLELFRVPEALLGKSDQSGLGRANIQTIEYIFAKRTIEPKLIAFDDTLRMKIKEIYKEDYIVMHESQVESDKDFELNEDNLAVDRWLTRNEIRIKRGYDPIEGGDTLYTNLSNIGIGEDVTSDSVTNGLNNGKKEIIKIKLKDNNKKGDVEIKKEATSGDLRLFHALDIIENRFLKLYKRNLSKLVKEQQRKIINLLESNYKSIVETSDLVKFNLAFTKEELELSLLPVLLDAIKRAGDLGIDLFGEPDQNFILDQAKRDAIFNSTERLMKSFNEETSLKLQKQLMAGLQESENVEQLTKRVKTVFKEINDFRAVRIANTESHSAINSGLAESFKQTGYKEMIWRTNPDACEFCKEFEGKSTKIGIPFLAKGGSIELSDGSTMIADYDDISYANLHPNCRCYIEPVTTSKSLAPVIIKEKDIEKEKELETELGKTKNELKETEKKLKNVEDV